VEQKFLQALTQIPDYQNKKYLIAISGGMDSVALTYLMYKNKLDFAMAHCNFRLRGDESDEDEKFIKNWSKQLNKTLYVKKCPVNENENTQLAARNMRYAWFKQLKKEHSFDYILTAHHLNDAIETFFINLFRGTGLKGLTGIPQTNDYLRPLLAISREEIHNFIQENNLLWREDSSNSSDKYIRNKIRHKLIPVIQDISPDFNESMKNNFIRLQETQSIIEEWFEHHKQNLITDTKEGQKLSIEKWKKIKNPRSFLYYWLSPYRFSDWKTIYHLPFAQSGKVIETKNYQLVKHTNDLILLPKNTPENITSYVFYELPDIITEPEKYELQLIKKEQIDLNEIKSADKDIAYIDFDRINFPIILRKKVDGDYFYPLGMKGKKKISDFYKDEKISLPEKQKIWLFCDANNIMWIPDKRLDDRYKVNNETQRILKIKKL
jgi:tRNA(Ile)-lysidine synthase